MANVNTDIVTNFVATPQVKNDSQQLAWRKKNCSRNYCFSCWRLISMVIQCTMVSILLPTNARYILNQAVV